MLKISRLPVALGILMFAAPAAHAQLSGVDGKPQFIKVTDRVYCATGYALGNVIFVIKDFSKAFFLAFFAPLRLWAKQNNLKARIGFVTVEQASAL